MLNALDINTRATIATGTDRRELSAIATALVGREGFCIREASPAPIVMHNGWNTSGR